MSSQIAWKEVKSFVLADSAQSQAILEINFLHNKIDALDQEIQSLDAANRNALNALQSTKSVLLSKEKEYTLITQKIKIKQDALDSVTSLREQTALEHEYNELEKILHIQEKDVLEALDIFEKAQEDAAACEAEKKQKTAELAQERALAQEKLVALTEKLTTLDTSTKATAQSVSQEWLATFNSIKRTYSDPVVKIITGMCSGCFYPVTTQNLSLLKKGLVCTCSGCFRLLYLDDEEQQ